MRRLIKGHAFVWRARRRDTAPKIARSIIALLDTMLGIGCFFSKNRIAFDNMKRRDGQALLCDACRQKDKDKELRLKKLLKGATAWRCKCKKIAPGRRAYASLHERLHSDRCDLSPTYAAEKRWDGKNVGVTLADLEFLAARAAY